ncbi:MAG TPA: chemotaxis protein CheW [Gemmatimonadaceae bacterium]|jgi:purine-binding chemotaxis protein CheW|nr:chemotaxis protein CheW [Gemmatimonadaceae bacterium]
MNTDVVKLVVFRIGDDLFAAEVLAVDRVLRYMAPNPVPDVPRWIEGVIEHRGGVIPVVDLRRRMERDEIAVGPSTRILVLHTSDGYVGAIADAVVEVAVVPVSAVAPPPPLFRGLAADAARGIAKVRDQLVVVLDVDRVLTRAERVVVDDPAALAGDRG